MDFEMDIGCLCRFLSLKLGEDQFHSIGDVAARSFFESTTGIGIELNRYGDSILWEIFHFREVSREPASVPVTRSPVARSNLYRKTVLVAGAASTTFLRVDTAQHLIQHLFL